MKSRIIPLCLLVLALGCTGIPGFGNLPNIASSSDPGVMITKFYADQEILKPREMTELTAQVTNAGGHRAENVEAMLFRLGGIGVSGAKEYSFGALEPADPTSKTPAEIKEHKWRVTAPASASKREGYNIGLQLKYDYTSDGWADFVATTKEGAKTTETAGGSGSSVGPIGVAVFAPPILLYEETTEGRLATVRVDLVNMATGYLSCSKAPADKAVNRLCSVQIRVPKMFLELNEDTGAGYTKGTAPILTPKIPALNDYWYCKPLPKTPKELKELTDDPELLREYVWQYKEEDGDIILTKDISDPEQADVLELMRGQEKSFVCTFKVKDIGPQQVIPIRAEAKYTYATEAALLLQVTG